MSKTLLGVDIGNSDLKMAVVSGGSVVKLAVERLPENLVRGSEIVASELLARFIKQLRGKYGLRCSRAAVALPEEATFFRRLTVPAMSAEQVALNLPYEFRDFVGSETVRYHYDYTVEKIHTDADGTPTSIDLIAAAARKDVVKEYAEVLRRAGLKLSLALPREMAFIKLMQTSAAAAADPDRELCLIDIGYEHTRVYIFYGSQLKASKVVDVGYRQVDAAIASVFNIDEYLAANYRTANHQDVLNTDACRAIYDQLSFEVRKTVNFYAYDNQQSALQEIYFCGGGVDIQPLTTLIAEDVGFTAHPITELLPDTGAQAVTVARAAAAIGVAL